jgi:hypothetical protein
VRPVDGAEAVLVSEGADAATLDAIAGVIRRRLAVFGEGDVLVARSNGQITVGLPVADTAASAMDVVTAPGEVSIQAVLAMLPTCPAPTEELAPAPVPFRDGRQGCAVLGPVLNTGAPLVSASLVGIEDKPSIDLMLTLPGVAAMQRASAACFAMTEDCPTGQMAIVLDGEVIAAPSPPAPTFSTPNLVLAGPFTLEDAAAITGTVAAGTLPAPLSVAERLVEVHRVVIGATPASSPTVVVLAQLGGTGDAPSSRLDAVSRALQDQLGALGIDGASVSANDDEGTLTVVATGSRLVPEALKESLRAALKLDEPFRLLVAPGTVA